MEVPGRAGLAGGWGGYIAQERGAESGLPRRPDTKGPVLVVFTITPVAILHHHFVLILISGRVQGDFVIFAF